MVAKLNINTKLGNLAELSNSDVAKLSTDIVAACADPYEQPAVTEVRGTWTHVKYACPIHSCNHARCGCLAVTPFSCNGAGGDTTCLHGVPRACTGLTGARRVHSAFRAKHSCCTERTTKFVCLTHQSGRYLSRVGAAASTRHHKCQSRPGSDSFRSGPRHEWVRRRSSRIQGRNGQVL